MKKLFPPAGLRVGTPCPKQWDDLSGNDAKRFCTQCSKHVHNLSVLPQREYRRIAQAVAAGEPVCIAYRRNSDGSVMRPSTARKRLVFAVRSMLALFLPWIFIPARADLLGKSITPSPGQHRTASETNGEITWGSPLPQPSPSPASSPAPDPIRGEAIASPAPPNGK